MTASAGGFDATKIPSALRPRETVVETAKPSAAIAKAACFEEGQLSGPFGPKFVGYGTAPKPSLATAFVTAAAIAALSGAVIIARSVL